MAELQIPNFVNVLANANQAAAQVNEQRRQNALAAYYRDNAQGLMSGDQNALAGLAQYDPQAAFGMQRQIQQDQQAAAQRAEAQAWRQDDRDYQRSRDARLDARADQEWKMRVDEYAATKSQQEREAEAAQIEQAVQQGLALPDAATWDAQMAQIAPDLVGRFGEREQIARGYLSIAEQLKASQAPAPMSGPGKVQADIDAGYLPQGTPLRGAAPSTTIQMPGQPTIGTVPQGFAAVADPNNPSGYRMEPIPGGPAEAERAAAAKKAELTGQTKAVSSDVVMNAAQKARDAIGTTSTGTISRGLRYIGESDAAEVQRQIDTMKANATIETLTAMRAASPTGGALGSVTEKEGAMLAAKLGALDPTAGPTRFREQLDDYERAYLRTIHGPTVGDAIYEQSRNTQKGGGEDGGVPSVTSDDEYDALPSGATFRDPNGVMRRKP